MKNKEGRQASLSSHDPKKYQSGNFTYNITRIESNGGPD